MSWPSAVLSACADQAATKHFYVTDLMTQHVEQSLRALTFPTPCLHGWITCACFMLGGWGHLQSPGHTCDLLQAKGSQKSGKNDARVEEDGETAKGGSFPK